MSCKLSPNPTPEPNLQLFILSQVPPRRLPAHRAEEGEGAVEEGEGEVGGKEGVQGGAGQGRVEGEEEEGEGGKEDNWKTRQEGTTGDQHPTKTSFLTLV